MNKFKAIREAQRVLIEVAEADTGTGDYLEGEAGTALEALNLAFGEYGEDQVDEEEGCEDCDNCSGRCEG